MTEPIIEEVNEKNIKLFIGTPCYSGLCTAQYTNSLLMTKDFLRTKGIEMGACFLSNESLIPRGRNTIVSYFLSNTIIRI